jgi:CheY-like chemotaxis protein
MPQIQTILPLSMLYIEDNALVREITCDLLADDIREIVAVASGEEGLDAFNGKRFDLAVTDISLPAMSGLEFVREVKKIAPEFPVILASGYPMNPSDFDLGSRIRAITKPFEAPQLRALIEDLCELRGNG